MKLGFVVLIGFSLVTAGCVRPIDLHSNDLPIARAEVPAKPSVLSVLRAACITFVLEAARVLMLAFTRLVDRFTVAFLIERSF